MKEHFYVYILSSFLNKVLYIGLTTNLPKRIFEHKQKLVRGFTSKYNVNRLVYYEIFNDAENAIKRERNMKEWKRAWKIELIEKDNPEWKDLYEDICA